MRNKLTTTLIIITLALILTSCSALYKFIGLTDQQAAHQTAKDQAATITIIETGREQLWQILAAATTAAGALLSGLLARWLGTERKITATLINAVESADVDTLKKTISTKATSAGIERQLNKRVRAIT